MYKNRSPWINASIKPSKENYTFNNNVIKPSDNSLNIAASHKWVASNYGSSGSLVVVPTDYSKYSPSKGGPPLINAHSQNVSDMVFSPFHPNILATGASDGFVKIWSVPQDGITNSISKATSSIGVGSNIFQMRFNPCADNILAVGSKQGVIILNLENNEGSGAEGGNITGVGWNYDGSLLAASNQTDKCVCVFDPRADLEEVLSNGTSLENSRKLQHIYFLTNDGNGAGQFGVFSISTAQKPILTIFDSRNMKKELKSANMSNSSGTIIPVYDYDTKLMYTILRSSCRLNTYDFFPKSYSLQPESSYSFDDPILGLCLAPKTVCMLDDSEISRIYALSKKNISSNSSYVARKVRKFDPKLYPDTIDTSKATMEGSEWLKGETKKPNLIDIKTLVAETNKLCGVDEKEEEKDSDEFLTQNKLKKKQEEIEKNKPVESVEYVETDTRKRLVTKFQSSPFRHLAGLEANNSSDIWYDNKAGEPVLMGKNIKANRLFLVFPAGRSGTDFRVQLIEKKGRSDSAAPLVKSKGKTFAFDLSQVQPNLLAVGSESGELRVFKIPDGGLKKKHLSDCALMTCSGKITVLKFHPDIEDVLFTGSSEDSSTHEVSVWNLKKSCIETSIPHDKAIIDITFDNFANLIATSCKDGCVRIVCPRTGEIRKKFKVQESLRETIPIFVMSHHMVVIGYSGKSILSMSIWDIESEPKQLESRRLGTGNYTPLPHYDPDINVLYLAKIGASSVETIQFSSKTPYFEVLNKWMSPSGDFKGHAFQHKAFTDARNVEIAKSYKYMQTSVVPISWTVPRKRKEYFQDDICLPVPECVSLMTVDEWFKEEGNHERKKISVQPKDMKKLSEAPPEEKTERQKRYEEQLRAQKEAKNTENKPKGPTGHTNSEEVKDHFSKMGQIMPMRNKWDAEVDDVDEIDDDEWDD